MGEPVDYAHLDAAGVAHVSLARALAAADDEEVKQRFANDVERARKALIDRQEEKVLRLAHISRQRIENPPSVYEGEDYETDIFNVIRSLFPYTEYWTGKNRPDGFCSLVHFDDASIRNPLKHNWSYDAKYTKSKKGYDLSIDEERKAWDYVAALMKQPELQVQRNELSGHVIISNNLDDKQMKKGFQSLRSMLGARSCKSVMPRRL